MTIATAAPATMRAAVLAAPRSASVRTASVPQPGPGQVRVRVQGCGVCGSNLPVWLGQPWFSYPLEAGAPGHEGWGVVDGVGDGVECVREGTRVAFLSSNAFAEFDIAPANALVELPPSLDGTPFPGEALACGINVVRRSRISPGETVVVVGVGFLGALVTRLATDSGARVIAVSRRPFALETARNEGAQAVVRAGDPEAVAREVQQITGGQPCACVIEAAGTQETLDLASSLAGVRGRLVIAGYHQDGPRRVDMQSWNWRGLDVINAHERDPRVYVNAMRAAATAMGAGSWNPTPLFTHMLGLDELPRAFELLDTRPPGFLKALVML